MLQVDILWVYGIGAMFATAAAKQIKSRGDFGIYMAALMIYISTIFVPEAIWLLWSFPSWETMHVWQSLDAIPTAYAALFIAGDALLALIGFIVAAKLILSGREYLAHIQWIAGYFGFFFVLIHGWDGTGWQRFTWDPTVTGEPWEPGKTMLFDFATSNVAFNAMAIPTIAPLIIGGYMWLRGGHKASGLSPEVASTLAARGVGMYLLGVGVSLLMALIATLISIYASCTIGIFSIAVGVVLTAMVAYLVALRRGAPLYEALHRYFNLI
ncbi:MAG: hypothetical protein ABWW66_03115 [Archaeoglobaceae archaeon]